MDFRLKEYVAKFRVLVNMGVSILVLMDFRLKDALEQRGNALEGGFQSLF